MIFSHSKRFHSWIFFLFFQPAHYVQSTIVLSYLMGWTGANSIVFDCFSCFIFCYGFVLFCCWMFLLSRPRRLCNLKWIWCFNSPSDKVSITIHPNAKREKTVTIRSYSIKIKRHGMRIEIKRETRNIYRLITKSLCLQLNNINILWVESAF